MRWIVDVQNATGHQDTRLLTVLRASALLHSFVCCLHPRGPHSYATPNHWVSGTQSPAPQTHTQCTPCAKPGSTRVHPSRMLVMSHAAHHAQQCFHRVTMRPMCPILPCASMSLTIQHIATPTLQFVVVTSALLQTPVTIITPPKPPLSPPPPGPGCVLCPQPSCRRTQAWWRWCREACAWQSPVKGWGRNGSVSTGCNVETTVNTTLCL